LKADVVIGAGYGDEGKGLMTDYLAHQYDESIVVRFNGGAQAGHTVVTPEGASHIFSHYGSGSFHPLSHTYLSQFFIVNPIVFHQEYVNAHVTIHPEAMVTTPFDMMVNQLQPTGGTCGLGINETVLRNQYLPLTMRDLSRKDLRDLLIAIRDNYIIPRLESLKIDLPPYLTSETILDQFIYQCRNMGVTVGRLRPTKTPIIFEGAQGLLLDNDFDIEFGTPSKTGLDNIFSLAWDLEIDNLDVNYMTRAYMTRHGNGPMPTHNAELYYEDRTNVHNPFQGKMRYGMFDYDLVSAAIQRDMAEHYRKRSPIELNPRLMVTHLDQMPAYVEYSYSDPEGCHEVDVIQREKFAAQMADIVGLKSHGESWGPTRKDVRCPTA